MPNYEINTGRLHRINNFGRSIVCHHLEIKPKMPSVGELVDCSLKWSSRSEDNFIHLNIFGSWATEIELERLYNNRDFNTVPYILQGFDFIAPPRPGDYYLRLLWLYSVMEWSDFNFHKYSTFLNNNPRELDNVIFFDFPFSVKERSNTNNPNIIRKQEYTNLEEIKQFEAFADANIEIEKESYNNLRKVKNDKKIRERDHLKVKLILSNMLSKNYLILGCGSWQINNSNNPSETKKPIDSFLLPKQNSNYSKEFIFDLIAPENCGLFLFRLAKMDKKKFEKMKLNGENLFNFSGTIEKVWDFDFPVDIEVPGCRAEVRDVGSYLNNDWIYLKDIELPDSLICGDTIEGKIIVNGKKNDVYSYISLFGSWDPDATYNLDGYEVPGIKLYAKDGESVNSSIWLSLHYYPPRVLSFKIKLPDEPGQYFIRIILSNCAYMPGGISNFDGTNLPSEIHANKWGACGILLYDYPIKIEMRSI